MKFALDIYFCQIIIRLCFVNNSFYNAIKAAFIMTNSFVTASSTILFYNTFSDFYAFFCHSLTTFLMFLHLLRVLLPIAVSYLYHIGGGFEMLAG